MKVKFEAEKLAKAFALAKSMPAASVNNVLGGDTVGMEARDGRFIGYVYSSNQYVRMIVDSDVDVLEEGQAVVKRDRFFQLLSTLKGPTSLQLVNNGARLQIHEKKSGKFSLGISPPTFPVMRRGEEQPCTIPTEPLLRLLKLCELSGELVGGGYKIVGKEGTLSVQCSDKLRFCVAEEQCELEQDFEFILQDNAASASIEVMKLVPSVEVGDGHHDAWIRATPEGRDYEFGFVKLHTTFPDISKILAGGTGQPYSATFEVGELIDGIKRAVILGEKELSTIDFCFDEESCSLETRTQHDDAVVPLEDCLVEESPGGGCDVLRLRADFVTQFAKRAKASKIERIRMQWGGGKLVSFEPGKDEVTWKMICSEINRNVAT